MRQSGVRSHETQHLVTHTRFQASVASSPRIPGTSDIAGDLELAVVAKSRDLVFGLPR